MSNIVQVQVLKRGPPQELSGGNRKISRGSHESDFAGYEAVEGTDVVKRGPAQELAGRNQKIRRGSNESDFAGYEAIESTQF